MKNNKLNVRYMAVTAMLSSIAIVLMYIEVSIPIMPSFIKLDFSDLPELIGAFAMGPLWGTLICLLKNLFHLPVTSSGGVGELSNFILGMCFVLPAGIIYKKNKTRKSAFIGAFSGALLMSVISLVSNYYLVYPAYGKIFGLTTDIIVSMYQVIYSGADTLWKCLIIFNLPFTFIKGMINVLITFLIYKHISPIIKGTNHY